MSAPSNVMRPVCVFQPQRRQRHRRLAGAGFADQPHRLAFAHRERYAVHRAHMTDGPAQHAAADGEMHLHVIGLQQALRIVRQRRRAALRHRGEQHARVGMERRREHVGDAAGLDDHAVLHHAHLVGVAAHDLQVVGDQQQRHAAAPS